MARYKSGYDLAEALKRAEFASGRNPETGYVVLEENDGSYKFCADEAWAYRVANDHNDPTQFMAYFVGGLLLEDALAEME